MYWPLHILCLLYSQHFALVSLTNNLESGLLGSLQVLMTVFDIPEIFPSNPSPFDDEG